MIQKLNRNKYCMRVLINTSFCSRLRPRGILLRDKVENKKFRIVKKKFGIDQFLSIFIIGTYKNTVVFSF